MININIFLNNIFLYIKFIFIYLSFRTVPNENNLEDVQIKEEYIDVFYFNDEEEICNKLL